MVKLLGSRSDSVLPGVRYLCVVPSLLFACPCCRWAYFYDLFFYIRFSVFDHCLLSLLCLSLDSSLLSWSLLFAVSLESFFAAFLADVFRTSVRSVNSDRGVIVYCLLRKSLGCLNWLVYLALLGEVSIADRRAIVYCLLRKSLGCLNRLVYMALLGEVSIE